VEQAQLQAVREAINTTRGNLAKKPQLQRPPAVEAPEGYGPVTVDRPLVLTEGAAPEVRVKEALAQSVDQMHYKALEALHQMAVWEPGKFLDKYVEFCEFILPKLARTEYTGNVAHKHDHFVAVERREADPRVPALIEAEVIDVTPRS
jgi:hypothetical protein